jgi:hypothetical protein
VAGALPGAQRLDLALGLAARLALARGALGLFAQ